MLRSIERETSTFCFITDDNLDPGARNELMLIFGAVKVWPGSYCPPRHRIAFEPPYLELNGFL